MERPGRPRSIDGRAEEEIRTKLSGSDHWKTSKISRIVQERSGVTYTRRHVRRMAKAWGYSLTTPRKKHKNSGSDHLHIGQYSMGIYINNEIQ